MVLADHDEFRIYNLHSVKRVALSRSSYSITTLPGADGFSKVTAYCQQTLTASVQRNMIAVYALKMVNTAAAATLWQFWRCWRTFAEWCIVCFCCCFSLLRICYCRATGAAR
jgi:hypothetical protein